MHRHDHLPSWIGAMSQKVVRSFASDHLSLLGAMLRLQRDPAAPGGLSWLRQRDRHQLIDWRGQISIRQGDIPTAFAHDLETELGCLAGIRLRLFQSFAVCHNSGKLGAGDSEPAFWFRPEMAEIGGLRVPNQSFPLHLADIITHPRA